MALALLTKGLIAPVFFIGAAVPYLLLTGQWRRWRELKPFTGTLLFLAIAAPWHILCGLANPDQGHRSRQPPHHRQRSRLLLLLLHQRARVSASSPCAIRTTTTSCPSAVYWLLHLVWLFPWSLFLPGGSRSSPGRRATTGCSTCAATPARPSTSTSTTPPAKTWPATSSGSSSACAPSGCSASSPRWTLLFFSLSSNQEYYTFPVWPPLFILIAAVVAGIEESSASTASMRPATPLSTAWLTGAQAVFAVIGVLSAALSAGALWDSRNLPFVSDIGTLLAHRGVGDYTLSMSHFFDLTGASFAALRLPAVLAAVALLIGPAVGWLLRVKGKHIAATVSIALTSAVFLVAAHIAFARFEPMLSSKPMADTIIAKGSPADTFIIYGDQSDASSVVFYTHNFFHGKPALLVLPRCGQHGEGIQPAVGFLLSRRARYLSQRRPALENLGHRRAQMALRPGHEPAQSGELLAGRLYPVQTLADKALWTDRPLQ